MATTHAQEPLAGAPRSPNEMSDDSSTTRAEGVEATNVENVEPQGSRHANFAEKSEPFDDDYDKVEITEDDCYDELGFSFPSWKKWTILTIIFLVQTSMNFNTSLYSNGLKGISKQYHVSEQGARCGAMIFLVLYAFGCELWAPWSEGKSSASGGPKI